MKAPRPLKMRVRPQAAKTSRMSSTALRRLSFFLPLTRSDHSPPGGAEASEINIRCSARFETGSSTRLQRASEPPWLQRRIDFPIVYRFVPSDYEQVYEFLGRRRLQARLIAAQLDNGLALF